MAYKEMKLECEEATIIYRLKQTKRKSIQISIEAPDQVRVIAPIGLSEALIQYNIEKKSKWILRKLGEVRELEVERQPKVYMDGEMFLYLGQEYSLSIEQDSSINKPVVKRLQDKVVVMSQTTDQLVIKDAMEKWYRVKTLEVVMERIGHYQPYFDVEPVLVKAKEQKKRWASCTARRHLLFNWRCSMAPLEVLDYIVVHEMCHMVHMNHSRDFWELVASIIPDYRNKRDWLKANGGALYL